MRLAVVILILFFPLLSHGEVYRWVDENGQIHFGSVPPKSQKPYDPGEIQDNGQKQSLNPESTKSKKKQKNVTEKPAVHKNAETKTNKKKSNEQNNKENSKVVTSKPKPIEKKSLEKESEKKREEKFQSLIKRLKNDLGVTKEQAKKKEDHENNLIDNQDHNAKKEKSVIDVKKQKVHNVKEKNKETKQVGAEEEEVKKEIESVEQAEVKYNEKCGFFSSFVDSYQDRIKYECPSEHCDLLKKKLEKYKNKAKQYCGDDNAGSNN